MVIFHGELLVIDGKLLLDVLKHFLTTGLFREHRRQIQSDPALWRPLVLRTKRMRWGHPARFFGCNGKGWDGWVVGWVCVKIASAEPSSTLKLQEASISKNPKASNVETHTMPLTTTSWERFILTYTNHLIWPSAGSPALHLGVSEDGVSTQMAI